jgi:hypothetical protein
MICCGRRFFVKENQILNLERLVVFYLDYFVNTGGVDGGDAMMWMERRD